MKFFDLDMLVKDDSQGGLYDLFQPTFNTVSNLALSTYVVTREQEMRPDLISKELYNSVDFADFICDLNDIDLALNIKENDVIYYVDIASIDSFRDYSSDRKNASNTLLNSNKTTRLDNVRQDYIENDYKLPPTVLDNPTAAVKIENNQIILGG